MSQEIAKEHTIIFEPGVTIDWNDPEVLHVGDCKLPKDIILSGSGRNLILKDSWRLKTDLERRQGMDGLHYPIVSTDPNEQRRFFIPSKLMISIRLK